MPPLQKQPLNINFQGGLDQKTDPFQVAPGKFLALSNSVFDTIGQLSKRNGFGALPSLPDTSTTLLTTFNSNLTAVGANLEAYSTGSGSWLNKGALPSCSLHTLPLIRSNNSQTLCDTAISPNGLICTVFTDLVPNGSGGTTASYKYAIADSVTGQNITAPTVIAKAATTILGPIRVFALGNNFIIVFGGSVSAVNHLYALPINSFTLAAGTILDLSSASSYTPSSTGAFDGVVANNNLYLAFAGGSTTIKMTYLTQTLTQPRTISYASHTATLMAVCADTSASTAVVYASFWDSSSTNSFTLAADQFLNAVLAPTAVLTSTVISNIASAAYNGICSIFNELVNAYSYDAGIPSNYINQIALTQAGVNLGGYNVIRSVGLASKPFIVGNGNIYFLAAYNSPYQPTYFLINGSLSTVANPKIVAKLAYSNGGGYYAGVLPSVNVSGTTAQVAYLFKDQVVALNKGTAGSIGGIYTGTGINLASFDIGATTPITAEIGNDLLLTGGQIWSYDGYSPVEQGFNLWPDSIETTASTSGGHMPDQIYYYQVTYEWTDNQGNLFRSAPSIPVIATVSGGSGSGSVTVVGPMLRATAKTANPVKIVLYRWSTANQVFYQVNGPTITLANDPTVDSWSFVDTAPDVTGGGHTGIVGNEILYTTGGVAEDIGPPASDSVTLFDTRLWLIDSEDRNLLWFSKPVIEGTPVEMSDLFTFYVPPTTASEGSTGVMSALAPMDDKLVIFKENAAYYINGTGPDITGAGNQYSQPIFITATVGCANQASIVFQPNGLMFQSNKGIWILKRDLSTEYIGAPVEDFTDSATVLSAVSVPGTNQIRFSLSSGVTLMYDYFVGQWGTFTGIPAISSTLFQGLHTFVNQYGQVFQETVGKYLDGANPVLMNFTTGWIHMAGLQGYQRAYYLYLLGVYLSPHKLSVQLSFDYAPSPTQSFVISTADQYSPPWGGDTAWGLNSSWGGPLNLEDWKVHFQRQRCEAFQISIQEIFDPSFGTIAGPGLTLSGLNLVLGLKKGYYPIRASRSTG
jgi:hypothetical protein